MFDLLDAGKSIFGNETLVSGEEILYRFSASYMISKTQMPLSDQLKTYFGYIWPQDDVKITFVNESDEILEIDSNGSWNQKYNEFISDLSEDEEINVSIRINKKVQESIINIYCLAWFSDFLSKRSAIDCFQIFTELFADCGEHITFRLLNSDYFLMTPTIAFSGSEVIWCEGQSRELMLKKCEDASIFLQRSQFALVPQDFMVQKISPELNVIGEVFGKIKTILAYIYLANTTNIIADEAVLHFEPSSVGYKFRLADLSENKTVSEIYDWVFKDEGCIDKACIVRKMISVYCRTGADVLSINENVLNAIKSDYVIYQKNHADQYIEMKNRISDYIVDSAKQIQELAHDLSDAFRNNFVAVIVFLMTSLLTDSIDFTQFLGKAISPNVAGVCGIFTVVTLAYFLATLYMANQKWRWLEESYNDLVANYTDVLDKKDIEATFEKKTPLENSRKQFCEIRCKISFLWIIMIVAMIFFTGLLIHNNADERLTHGPVMIENSAPLKMMMEETGRK